jgi:hypothetical protein
MPDNIIQSGIARIKEGVARRLGRKRIVAVFCHPSHGEPTLPSAVPSPSDRRYFSSWGDLDEPGADIERTAHYLSTLGPDCKTVVLCKWAVPLPPSVPLAGILVEMLTEMGRGGRIHVEVAGNWIGSDWLQEVIPGITVEAYVDQGRKWLLVEGSPGHIDAASIACSHRWLTNHRSEFRDFYRGYLRWLESTPQRMPFKWDGDTSEAENPFGAMFSYGLSWAFLTRSVFEQVAGQSEPKVPLKGLDIGGAHGFLACELALLGHEVVNVDLFGQRFRVMDWIAEGLGVSGRVSGVWAPMQEFASGGRQGKVDFACFTNSLVCIERDQVASTIVQVSKMLRPGGFILVRENVTPESRKSGNLTTFTHQELLSILESSGGELEIFSHLGIRLDGDEIARAGTWFVAIRFSGMPDDQAETVGSSGPGSSGGP